MSRIPLAAALVVAGLILVGLGLPSRADARTPAPAPLASPDPELAAFVPFSPNVRVNNVDLGYSAQGEPSLVVNSAGRIFVGWMEGMVLRGTVAFAYSADGGATWSTNVLIPPAGSLWQAHAWLTVDPADRVFYHTVEYDNNYENMGLGVRNTTTGDTWDTPFYQVDTPNRADKETAAHDSAGNLYRAWSSVDPMGAENIAFSRSDNGGATWTPRVFVPDTPQYQYGGFVQVHPNGTVLVSWLDAVRKDIMLDRSFDGGATWGMDVPVNDVPGSVTWGAAGRRPYPAMAVSPNGTVYVTWADSRNGNMDILLARSADGGATWSASVRVDDDSTGAVQWLPDLAVDPFGGVHVAWVDDRNGAHDVYYTNSTDGGATFAPNVRVTTESTPLSIANLGEHIALESDNQGNVYVAWTDGRNPDLDVYFARLNYTARMTVDTIPSGLAVEVDGTSFPTPHPIYCTTGASFAVNAVSPQVVGGTRYTFASWSDGGAQSHSVTCDPGGSYVATFTAEHGVVIDTAPPNLQVVIDGSTLIAPQTFWWAAGSSHNLSVPSPQGSGQSRYSFANWSDGGAQSHDVDVTAPRTYVANFTGQHEITVTTDPPGITVTVDGVSRATPYVFWCDEGTSHVAEAPTSPPSLPETVITFIEWVPPGLLNVTAIACDGPAVHTARYLVEHMMSVDASPAGLLVEVDGSPFTAPHVFLCASGTMPILDVPSPQGVGDTRHTFQSWSDGGAKQHAVSCVPGATFVATFEAEHRVTITTLPPGLQIVVDGSTLTAPQSFWWIEGTTHTVDVASPQGSAPTRHLFASWSDGGGQAHDVVVAGPATLTATFDMQHALTVSSPRGTPRCDVADCWYGEGGTAGFSVDGLVPGPTGTRYVFAAWIGDSLADTNASSVVMDGPKTVTATWTTEYLLTIQSERGNPQGAGWYAEGETAHVEVEGNVTTGGTTYRFAGWTGDATAASAACDILMDAPKTVTATWREVPATEPGTSVIWLLPVLVVVALLIILVLLWRRRRARVDEPTAPTDDAPAADHEDR